jgi:hypothetical protein
LFGLYRSNNNNDLLPDLYRSNNNNDLLPDLYRSNNNNDLLPDLYRSKNFAHEYEYINETNETNETNDNETEDNETNKAEKRNHLNHLLIGFLSMVGLYASVIVIYKLLFFIMEFFQISPANLWDVNIIAHLTNT